MRGGFLLDGDRRRQPFDVVDVRFFHQRQELTRIGGERFNVAALSFGIQRVESQRGLAGTRQPGDDNQFVARDDQVDVLEIVGAGAPNFDLIHSPFPVGTRIAWFV